MSFKRVIAYIIDILIITFASSMLASISYINPQLDKYNKVYNEYVEVNKKYIETMKENKPEEIEKIKPELNDLSYQLDRNNLYGATIQIVLTVLYFAVFQMLNHGQTLGKKLMKLKVAGDLNLFKYILRTIILHNILINLLKIVFVLTFSKENYILASNILYVGALLVEVTIIIMVSMRADKRGLHDLITGSSVVPI